MEILLILLLLLLVTKIGADLAVLAGQPALVGELLGGVLLGLVVQLLPATAEFLTEINTDRSFEAILDLAVFFLMLVAGLEMRPRDLASVSGKAIPVAMAGMFVPLALGIGLGWYWLPESDWKVAQSLFLGVALAITAVPVAVKVLIDLGSLQTETGQTVVAAAVIDDVLSLLLLAVLTALLSGDQDLSATGILLLGGKVLLFFTVVWLFSRFALGALGKLVSLVSVEYAHFTAVIMLGLLLSVFAELLDMHFLIGAFAAGLMFNPDTFGEEAYGKVSDELEALTLGFLAPIFFASIGIHLSLAAAVEIPMFVAALLACAIIGKLAGAGGTAMLTGMRPRQALAVGSAMNARGAVEIIIADIALRAGLFEKPEPVPPVIEYLFSAVVIMAIVTTLLSPILMRFLLTEERVRDPD